MSAGGDENAQPNHDAADEEVCELPDAVVRRVRITVQCATEIEPPTYEDAAGVYCNHIIEAEVDLPYEPEYAAEIGVECPACSKRVSEAMAKPVKAVIPIAILVGAQVSDNLDSDDAAEEETPTLVEVTPEDQS